MKTRKILFAAMPFEGHFNPLTGIAKYLQSQGHDVRWYAGGSYARKLAKLEIPHYPFQKAPEINQENMDAVLPDRASHKGAIAKIKFDIKHVFVLPVPDMVADIEQIYKEFKFDVIVCDNAFAAGYVVREKFKVPLVSIGVMPLSETSKGLAPTGLGLTPPGNFLQRQWYGVLRYLVVNIVLKESIQLFNSILHQFGIAPVRNSIFDLAACESDVYLQSGVPGFEYTRDDMSPRVRFVGPLLPIKSGAVAGFKHLNKLSNYKKVILVTQGTVERDSEKLLVPTLEAFKDTNYLVVVTTGGSQTQQLRDRYPHDNIVIEDFIDFRVIMPLADVYVTNGGYGGVMLSLENKLPLVVAGVHEGKNEINARVGYFKLGINLKTETPAPGQIRQAVERVLTDETYKRNVHRLSQEFERFNPNQLCEQYIMEVLEAEERDLYKRHPLNSFA